MKKCKFCKFWTFWKFWIFWNSSKISQNFSKYEVSKVSYAQFCFLATILFFGGHFVFQQNISKFVQTVHTNFLAKSRLCSSRIEQVMLNFAIWRPFCFLRPFCFSNCFVRTIHMNFHSKSGVCSSKKVWVMLNLVFCPFPSRSVTVTNLCILI